VEEQQLEEEQAVRNPSCTIADSGKNYWKMTIYKF
jgi:hypothetical protein